MATTKVIDHYNMALELSCSIIDFILAISLIIAPFVFSYFAFVWVRSWLRRRSAEGRARELIRRFDTHQVDFLGALEDAGAIDADGNVMRRNNLPRGWARVRTSRLEAVAFALADEAYFQFGQREKSEANDLCTRKFLRDQISEYTSLRAKDKSIVLAMALTLSYVGPSVTEEMQETESTDAYAVRTRFQQAHRW